MPISALESQQRAYDFSNTYGEHKLGPIGQWLQKIGITSPTSATSRRTTSPISTTSRRTMSPTSTTSRRTTSRTTISDTRPGITTVREVVVTAPKPQSREQTGSNINKKQPARVTTTTSRVIPRTTTPKDWNREFQNELASWSQEDIKKLDELGFDFSDARNLQNSINVYLANNGNGTPLKLDNKWGNKSKAALRSILDSYTLTGKYPNTQYEQYYEPINDYWNTDTYYAKKGAKLNKFQKGGQMNEKQIKEAFIQFLAQKSGAKTQQELEKYIQSLGEEGLKQVQQEFIQLMQQQTQKAAKGAKLNYIRQLAHKCPEGEELYYFKRGGSVGCGCKKKEDGGEVTKAQKGDTITKFKNRKKTQIAEEDTIHTKNGVKDLSGKTNYPKFDPKKATKEERRRASDKDYMAGRSAKQGAKLNKNCGGSKMKLEKGDKVCPKCGKVHAAGMGCTIAKFKMHRQGGSLNGVPFMQQGKNLPTAPKAEDRYKKGRRVQLPYYKEVYTPTNRMTLTHGASIRQYVEPITPYYNDTTYVEIPEHTSFVKLSPRVASTNSIEDLNSPILDNNGWPTGYYKFKFNNSPEYETLKRRFNTAWNLAK